MRHSRQNLSETTLTIALICLDVTVVLVSFYCAVLLRVASIVHAPAMNQYIRDWFRQSVFTPDSNFPFLLFIYFALATVLAFKYCSLYQEKGIYRRYVDLWSTIKAITGMLIVTMLLLFIFKVIDFPRMVLIYFWLLSILMVTLARTVFDVICKYLRIRFGVGRHRSAIVGKAEPIRELASLLADTSGFQTIGYICDEKEGAPPVKVDGDALEEAKPLGPVDAISEIIQENDIMSVFVIDANWSYSKLMNIVRECTNKGVDVWVISEKFKRFVNNIPEPVEYVMNVPVLRFSPTKFHRLRHFIKRCCDIAISSVVLIVGMPLWLVVALLIKLESVGPVIFKQKRVTKGGKTFTCYKFRSMYADAEKRFKELMRLNEKQPQMFKIKNDPRITKIGRIIRRMSIDEIPQMINVLKGDITLVGPRAPIPQEVTSYKEWHAMRLREKTGLTGLWQVSGRSELDFDEMVVLDIYYLLNRSLSMDFRIITKTIFAVFFARGAY